ncbi:MAG TPA: hypothetical protein VND94_18860 [Terriglobia bacterium]|nr:hypothetical protein [Terriglobia bacterium]
MAVAPLTDKSPVTLVQRAKWDDFTSGYRIKAVGNPEVAFVYVQRGCGPLPVFRAVPSTETLARLGGYVQIEPKTVAHLQQLANNAIMAGTRQIDIGVALSPPGEFKDD